MGEMPCFAVKSAVNLYEMRETVDVFPRRKALQENFSTGWSVTSIIHSTAEPDFESFRYNITAQHSVYRNRFSQKSDYLV